MEGHKVIDVYSYHPEWDRVDKWFNMPGTLLMTLHVAAYVCTCNNEHDCDQPTAEAVDKVKQAHPGCVLVYVD